MRLIDADKLIASLKPKESVWVGLVLAQLVTNVPTIEAIPIEWIKRKAFENPSLSRNLFYRLIIDEWEKENDKDSE